MALRRVTVFGGSGFLGRQVVARLAEAGIHPRVASRHPERRGGGPAADRAPVVADIRDRDSVARALAQADGAVNCVGLYRESRTANFHDIHVEGAAVVAEAAAARQLPLVHISGIGADPQSNSSYVRARAEGEAAVRAAHPDATILRPSVMFGPDDAFLDALDRITAMAPVMPLFGDGGTRLQPVHVADVAAAVVRALEAPSARGRVFELGGPHALTYRRIIELVLASKGRRRLLLPVPFALWRAAAVAGRLLPVSPVTDGQVALMRRDNVVSPAAAGFAELGLTPQPLEATLRSRP